MVIYAQQLLLSQKKNHNFSFHEWNITFKAIIYSENRDIHCVAFLFHPTFSHFVNIFFLFFCKTLYFLLCVKLLTHPPLSYFN